MLDDQEDGGKKYPVFHTFGGASPEVAELNQQWFLCSIGGKAMMVRETRDQWKPLEFSGLADFKAFYLNRLVRVREKECIPLGTYWLRSPHRRQYSGIVFDPRPNSTAEAEGKYNMWKGWTIQPRQGDWSKLRHHIVEVLSGGSEYPLNWTAQMLQRPWEIPETSLVFTSGEGAGKGMFLREVLLSCTSPYSIAVSRTIQLTGRFNEHLAAKIYIFADEVHWQEDEEARGALFSQISEPVIQVEGKYKTPITVENFARVAMASNRERVVPAGHDARRFAVFHPSDAHQQDYRYFEALKAEIVSGGIEAMAWDLLLVPLGGFQPRAVPITRGLVDQKLQNLPPVPKWWHEKLLDGRLPGAVPGLEGIDWPGQVLRDVLFADYADWHQLHRPRSNLTGKPDFGKTLRAICPAEAEGSLIRDGPRPTIKGKREYTYHIPALTDARFAFARWLKAEGQIDWPVPQDEQPPAAIVPFRGFGHLNRNLDAGRPQKPWHF